MATTAYGTIPKRRGGYRCTLCNHFGFRSEGTRDEDFDGWVHWSCRARWIRMDKEDQRWELDQERRKQ